MNPPQPMIINIDKLIRIGRYITSALDNQNTNEISINQSGRVLTREEACKVLEIAKTILSFSGVFEKVFHFQVSAQVLSFFDKLGIQLATSFEELETIQASVFDKFAIIDQGLTRESSLKGAE